MCDEAIIAEHPVPPDNGNWVADRTGTAAIHVPGRFRIQEVVDNSGEGFVIAKTNGVDVCSCYAPPRWTVEHFSQMVDQLTDNLIGWKPILIAGDFNVRAAGDISCRKPPGHFESTRYVKTTFSMIFIVVDLFQTYQGIFYCHKNRMKYCGALNNSGSEIRVRCIEPCSKRG